MAALLAGKPTRYTSALVKPLALTGILSLMAMLAVSPASGARSLDPHFERVGSESGPPFSVITALHQDRVGFLWIGSRNGLALFDGHAWISFEHDPSDPSSISDDQIRVLHEDESGRLWVGTNTGGLNQLDRAARTFVRFRHESGNPQSLSHDSVYAIADAGDGKLWVGTQRGLNLFDPQTGIFERFLADAAAGGPSNNYISALLVDRSRRLWVGTVGGGLNRYDAGRKTFEVWGTDPANPSSLGDDSVFALLEDASGSLWVGTNAGLDRMDPQTSIFRHYHMDSAARGAAGRPIVSSLAAGPGGAIWAGTFGSGLHEVDPRTETIRVFQHAPGRPGSIPANRVLSLLADRAGALWVGTWGGGLSRISGSALVLASGTDEVPEPEGLEDRDVTGIARDEEGGLWVGMRSGTLLRRNPDKGSWRSYPLENPGSILRILPVRDQWVWLGTSRGLVRLDPRTGRSTWFTHDPDDPNSLGSGFVPALLMDRPGSLWVGTGEGGLNEIDPDGRVLRRFVNAPSDPKSLSDDYITVLHEDRSGILWVGTRSGGVNELDRRTGQVVRHQPDPGDARSLSHHNITAIHEDAAGRLWIATSGGGLNLAERSGNSTSFTRYTAADGLVNNNVMALLEDDDGSLWLSTKRGLARFNPRTGAFTNYFVEDGLPSSEFEFGAAVRTEGGLLFGSVTWVAAVPSGTRLPDAAPSPTVITGVRGQSDHLPEAAPWSLDRLEIPWGTWFSIEVAVLDFNTQHNHAHAYRLRQNGEDFVELGANRTITFADLAPGRYEFTARGRNCQGVWTQTNPALRIDIVPPFWMTTWFRLVSVALFAAAIILAHRVRLSSLERRNRELVNLHGERERASRDLELAYARLQSLARRLEAAKEEERRKIARELHDDLGPALTAVVINLQLLGQERDSDKAARRVDDSIDLVDRIVQQIRDLSLDLRPPLMDEMGLVGALKGYLETQAERTGLEIVVDGDATVEGLSPEMEITAFRVVQEAVTNVIRHASARRIQVGVRAESGELEITVTDDGRGFDARAALEAPATGKSLGLLGMQERAKMLGGLMRIDSSAGNGTRVRVHIPLKVMA